MTETKADRWLEGAELTVNENYDCDESGHIMGIWMVKKGVGPGGPATEYRTCQVPGCKARQLRKCYIAPSGP